MEELLNKLCDRGRMPRGIYNATIQIVDGEICLDGCLRNWSLRELVSNESGLWQFVCEKELVYRIWHDEKTYKKRKNDDGETKFAYSSDYWIIQSSLCEEENIEQFLLDNIKIS